MLLKTIFLIFLCFLSSLNICFAQQPKLNVATGALLTDLKGHAFLINSAQFGPNGKNIVLPASSDGTAKIWNASTAKLIYTFLAVDSMDYFMQIPSGYYHCTSNAAKLLYYVTNDLKVITFDQLDVKFNRPDKVLEAIGNTDTALIESYRKAYEKRIKKLGIDSFQRWMQRTRSRFYKQG